jgi:hypothetical protein
MAPLVRLVTSSINHCVRLLEQSAGTKADANVNFMGLICVVVGSGAAVAGAVVVGTEGVVTVAGAAEESGGVAGEVEQPRVKNKVRINMIPSNLAMLSSFYFLHHFCI